MKSVLDYSLCSSVSPDLLGSQSQIYLLWFLPFCFRYLLERCFAAPLLLPLGHFCLYEVLDSRYNSGNGSFALWKVDAAELWTRYEKILISRWRKIFCNGKKGHLLSLIHCILKHAIPWFQCVHVRDGLFLCQLILLCMI